MESVKIEELTDGQSLDELTKDAVEHQWFQMQQLNDVSVPDGLRVIVDGEGIYLKDAEGKQYIDGISGLWVVAVGHGRKRSPTQYTNKARGSPMPTPTYMETFQPSSWLLNWRR